MNYDQFYNLSCYEEFEIQSVLSGISKIDILKEIGHKVNGYYFFVSNDGIFIWFDLEGNHVKDPGVLTIIKDTYIPKTITKCVIPNNVISIGRYAFDGCKSLKEITIPDSVISIDDYAFFSCKSLTSITIPDSVTSINTNAFYNCKSLASITIPDSITKISDYAFSFCKLLTSITISNNVTSIGEWIFDNCKSLKEVIFKGKTLNEVKQMENYPFGIEDESIIKCEL